MNDELKEKARAIRRDLLREIYIAGSGHPGGSLSAVELLVALYYRQMKNLSPEDPRNEERDRFTLSKAHACPALYAVLADKGYFPREELDSLRKLGSRLQGHPDRNKLPGLDAGGGSLGQGISIAVGMALGAKYRGRGYGVYTMVGDGELQEGQCWEAMMSAAHYGLDNLTIIIDNNGLQIDGTNDEVMSLGKLADKLRAFGLSVQEIDGHDFDQIFRAFDAPRDGKPKAILAHTVKGRGVSFMENQVGWHGHSLTREEYERAMRELA